MTKKSVLVMIALAAVVVIALCFAQMPEQITGTVTVATETGETATVEYDLLYYSNFILPSYVKGTLTVDGVEYTDQYSMFEQIPSVEDNALIPSDWWQSESAVPYNMTFVRSDCADVISAQLNKIDVLDVVLDKGICKIHYLYFDERNAVDGVVSGISFWGPAQNAEEAAQTSEFFGYSAP